MRGRIVGLVERMLALPAQAAGAKTPPEAELGARQIEAVDGKIDQAVYLLYGLSAEEIGIVEGGQAAGN